MDSHATIVSVNVGRPIDVDHDGRVVRTGIFKEPQQGRVRVCGTQLAGDGQADWVSHGGIHKAVYAYPHEHYGYWSARLGIPLPTPGQFGENLTIRGLSECDVGVGDVLSAGSVRFQVTQPRKPCFKLGLRMQRPTFPKEFLASGRLGFYLRVLHEGDVGAGDRIQVEQQGPYGLSIDALRRIVFVDKEDVAGARQALEITWLAEEFRRPLERRLERGAG